jgi:uncharacterized membrane protein
MLACALLVTGCQKDAPDDPGSSAGFAFGTSEQETWEGFTGRFIEEHLAAHPAWAVVQGRHDFDGQLPDWSKQGIQAEAERLKAARIHAIEFPDDLLTDEQRFQQEYLVARIDHDLFWLDKARWPFRNPQFYIGWMSDSLDPAPYITLDYAPPEERMKAYIRYLSNVPVAAHHIRQNLEMPMPRTWLQLGVDAFSGYAAYFRDEVPAVWAEVENPTLQREFDEVNEVAIQAMRGLADWLESNRGSATEDFALGPDLFQQMLWDTERVDIPLDQLEAVGRQDMARNLQGLRDACAEFAPGAELRDCFAKMADRKPEDGSVEAARYQMAELRIFLEYQDLVTVPGTEKALVDEAPPYARSNSAYISIPGPWDRGQPSVYYISPPNPDWPEDVQADYIPGESDLLFTSVHEVWPGHFLNFLHANRVRWLFGRAFVGYAFAEGWAHYSEEMMLEAGLRKADPETRIGQLSNALLRNARFLSSIGLHTQGWSVDDARRFFMEEGFQSEGTAIQQAARGTYDPAFLNYNMGKLLIRQLREDWTALRGGRESWKEFHDMFLSFGGPPIPLVRQQMMGEQRINTAFPSIDPNLSASPASLVVAWQCDSGAGFVSSEEGRKAWVFLPELTLELSREDAAEGTRYSAQGVVFWNQGEEATLESADGTINCLIDRQATPWEDAKLRGADFRGLGNEPGWYLELFTDGDSLLVTEYGTERLKFRAGEPTTAEDGAGTMFRGSAGERDIVITLTPGPCQDSMADLEYETSVRIDLGEQSLAGCGKALH